MDLQSGGLAKAQKYGAAIKEQSMHEWPEQFIQSSVSKITVLHWPDQLQTITPMV